MYVHVKRGLVSSPARQLLKGTDGKSKKSVISRHCGKRGERGVRPASDRAKPQKAASRCFVCRCYIVQSQPSLPSHQKICSPQPVRAAVNTTTTGLQSPAPCGPENLHAQDSAKNGTSPRPLAAQEKLILLLAPLLPPGGRRKRGAERASSAAAP